MIGRNRRVLDYFSEALHSMTSNPIPELALAVWLAKSGLSLEKAPGPEHTMVLWLG